MKKQKIATEVMETCRALSSTETTSSVVLYGSQARGDSNSDSDIDILLIGDKPFTRKRHDNICICCYPSQLLIRFAREGALFALHLKEEAIVISDPHNQFSRFTAEYSAPRNYDALKLELALLANVLDVNVTQYRRSPAWLNRVGLYILRSTLFSKFAENGEPMFSMRSISESLGDETLWKLYSRKYKEKTDYSEFCELRSCIEKTLETQINNATGSLSEYLLQRSGTSQLVRAFASRLCELSDNPDVSMLMANYVLGQREYPRPSTRTTKHFERANEE